MTGACGAMYLNTKIVFFILDLNTGAHIVVVD